MAPDPEVTDPARKIAFLCALAMLFVRMSVLPEVISHVAHVNTYLLYLVTPPAVLGLLASGGLGRAYRFGPVWYWTGMLVCMILAVPFSSWVGGSADRVIAYSKTDFVCLLVLAGTVATWAEIRKLVSMMTLAGVFVLISARIFAHSGDDGRLALDLQGTIGNPNDLAAHLVLLIPFILAYALRKGTNTVVRLILLAGSAYGVWVIIGTASRGAMIAMAVMCLLIFIRGTQTLRITMIAVIPTMVLVIVVAAPERVLMRLATLFVSSNSDVSAEAGESMASRSYLLQQSIKFTLQHPVFGVGPGQFSSFEGKTMIALGQHGNWHETHNSYTQVSSECGLPALIFMLLALVGTGRLVNQSYRRAKAAREEDVAHVCSFYLVSLVGYCITITFLACGYRWTLPAIISFGVAIYVAANRQLKLAGSPA